MLRQSQTPCVLIAAAAVALAILSSQKTAASDRSNPPPIQESSRDDQYGILVAEGRKLEERGRFKEALERYRRALKVKRYEIPSYYVLLDIGRAEYKSGAYVDAIKNLEEYLKAIAIELRVEKGEMMPPGGLIIPGYPEEGLKLLLEDKAEAEALIVASKARLAARQRR